MKIQTFIILALLILFFPNKAISQITVKIENMTYINGTSVNTGGAIEIESGQNSRIQFAVDVNNPNGNGGTLKVYTKKSSSDFEQQQGASETIFSGTTFFVSSRDVILYASNFNSSGGFLYAEFESTGGIKYKSSSYSIKVVTSPDPDIENNYIVGNQSVEEGGAINTISGSVPVGGNGIYSYQWEKKTTAAWNAISGANTINYLPTNINTTTHYRRKVTSGNAPTSISNNITITYYQAPAITNNSIDYNGSGTFIGSEPNGGTGTYTYQWYLSCECSGGNFYFDPIDGATSKNYTIPTGLLNSAEINRMYFSRRAYSGSRTNITPEKTINGALTNNSISFNGVNKMIGSLPQGATGNYEYEWRISNNFVYNEIIQGANQKDYTIPQIDINNNNAYGNYYKRIVKSGFETIETSWVTFCPNCKTNNLSIKEIKVYPNPANNEINFETDILKNESVAIDFISIETGRVTRVYEGKVKSNEGIINIVLSSNFRRGMYSYIISSGKEILTGKIVLE